MKKLLSLGLIASLIISILVMPIMAEEAEVAVVEELDIVGILESFELLEAFEAMGGDVLLFQGMDLAEILETLLEMGVLTQEQVALVLASLTAEVDADTSGMLDGVNVDVDLNLDFDIAAILEFLGLTELIEVFEAVEALGDEELYASLGEMDMEEALATLVSLGLMDEAQVAAVLEVMANLDLEALAVEFAGALGAEFAEEVAETVIVKQFTIVATDFDSGIYGKAAADGSKDIRPDEEVNTEVGGSEFGGNIGWIGAGDWVQYTIDVAVSGVYRVEGWLASDADPTGSLKVSVGGEEVGTSANCDKNGWQDYSLYTVGNVYLAAGTQVITAEFPNGGVNFAALEFTRVPVPITMYELIYGQIDPPEGAMLLSYWGELIGTTGWGGDENTDFRAAFDNDSKTYFDPEEAASFDCYAGVVLPEAFALVELRLRPRKGFLGRFNGATIQGSNDGEEWTTLWRSDKAAISEEYLIITTDMFENNTGYTYYRYVNDTEHGDIAELRFWGVPVK